MLLKRVDSGTHPPTPSLEKEKGGRLSVALTLPSLHKRGTEGEFRKLT